MPDDLVFGWYSPTKAKYLGVDIYQERDIVKGGRVLKAGRRLVVTDISEEPTRFRENGDEQFVAVMSRRDFVKNVKPIRR